MLWVLKITVAGVNKEVKDGLTIGELIQQENVETPEYVTVSVNEEFVDGQDRNEKSLKDGDVDAAASHHCRTLRQFVLELLNFLALLLLWTDHEEIHDCEDGTKHEKCHEHAVASLLTGFLCC